MGTPRTTAGYNSHMQIFQDSKTIAIEEEMLHNGKHPVNTTGPREGGGT
jgi:hypothetical protein